MKNRIYAAKLVVAIAAILAISCSESAESAPNDNLTLVGSTACDAGIKSALGIPADLGCDFIRWNLDLDTARGNLFALDINYGASQPNTPGFVDGGLKLSATGKFETTSLADKREVYRMKSAKPAIDVSLIRINSNLFHLVMPDGTMMIGNGGWSYTLNRSTPLTTATLPKSMAVASAKNAQAVFDGRTPCNELVTMLDARRTPECFKVKWRVTLNRDPATMKPTTFAIRGVTPHTEGVKEVTGKWSENKPAGADPTVLRLVPDTGGLGVSLMVADDNILFFLDSNGRPLVGNKDFSFTLNRRSGG